MAKRTASRASSFKVLQQRPVKLRRGITPASTDPERANRPPPPATPAWLDPRVRGFIAELNEGLIRAMVSRAGHAREATNQVDVPHRLAALTPTTRARLAHVPFVLLDADFAAPMVWTAEHLNRVHTHMEDSEWVDGYELHVLARALFSFAWQFASSFPDATGIVLGMSGETTAVFANLSLRDLERVILQRGHWVRPRWEEKPDRWLRLLRRAQKDSNPSILGQRALQLLFGDALARAHKS
ncbi:MAG: hypothetical protein WDO56_09775 [Gammaproteobacteria bacterium]